MGKFPQWRARPVMPPASQAIAGKSQANPGAALKHLLCGRFVFPLNVWAPAFFVREFTHFPRVKKCGAYRFRMRQIFRRSRQKPHAARGRPTRPNRYPQWESAARTDPTEKSFRTRRYSNVRKDLFVGLLRDSRGGSRVGLRMCV